MIICKMCSYVRTTHKASSDRPTYSSTNSAGAREGSGAVGGHVFQEQSVASGKVPLVSLSVPVTW